MRWALQVIEVWSANTREICHLRRRSSDEKLPTVEWSSLRKLTEIIVIRQKKIKHTGAQC